MAAISTAPVSISSSSSFPTATAMLAIATAASNSTDGGDSRPGADGGECKLLGPFALFIQGALGILALLSLVFKRWRERPQRPVKIWAFDASKQVVGSALLHVANLLLSMISSGELANVKAEDYQANPCSFYLLNLAIDVCFPSCPFSKPSIYRLLMSSPLDYPRHPHPDRPPQISHLRLLPHPPRPTPRIHPIRKLRSPPQNKMVAKAVHNLLHRPARHEDLRLHHLPALPVDHPRRGLGAAVDGGQPDAADLLRDAVFSGGDECATVLYY